GEAEGDQRGVEQLARVVAGERPSGAVGAAQSRRKADDDEARARIAEGGNGRVPEVREPGPVLGPEGGEARAVAAIARRAGVEAQRSFRAYSRNSPAGSWTGAYGPRRWSADRGGRSLGSRPILWIRWARSMNSSAWRRSSSATIGGWV